MCVPFGCTRSAAHLNRRKRFEDIFGPQPITAVAATLFLPSCCVPHIQGYRRYLCTLFVFSINRKIASQLQSFGVCEMRMAPDHENRRGVVRGMMQQAPPKSLSTAVTTP